MPDFVGRFDNFSDEQSEIGLLYDFLTPPEWHRSASCKNAPAEISWFPGHADDVRPAVEICVACPVQCECELAATQAGEKFGIWGGRSQRDRKRFG